MVERKDITISWIESEKQLANCLTKRGASCDTLINVVQSGKLTVLFYLFSHTPSLFLFKLNNFISMTKRTREKEEILLDCLIA